jgi:hypothetical protein
MLLKHYKDLSDTEKKNILNDKYVAKKMSFADIASEYKTYANKIRRDAVKFGIKIRDKSEAQSNALKSGKHCHPTKGKQRTDDVKEKIGISVMKNWEDLTDAELDQRKKKSKLAWENLSDEQKENITSAANKAVRVSSKVGSKLEKFILKKLLQDGFVVEFHKEQILSNTKLQIDLFLPTMNVAIEIDGPSHFLPVWGDDALKRNQKYDQKKTGLLLGKGLSLIRVKQQHDYSNARALLVYNKLKIAIDIIKDNTNTTIEIEDSL